jgi:hypothetical protein
MLYAVHNVAV